MLLRVRNNVGVWRVDQLEEGTATVSDVLDKIASIRPHVVYQKPLCSDPKCEHPLDTTRTLAEQNFTNGSMVYCLVDPSTCADQRSPEELAAAAAAVAAAVSSNSAMITDDPTKARTLMKRVIGKDGNIRLVPTNEVVTEEDRGFRKGLLPLRDIKMQWTLSDFTMMDAQYVFKIQRQEAAICSQASLDTASVQDFSNYLRRFNFSRARFGYLYGKYVDVAVAADSSNGNDGDDTNGNTKKRAIVEAIYEPPQEADPNTAEGFVMLDDPREETVQKVAEMLGLQKVGWIFGHDPQRRRQSKTIAPYVLSSAEIIMAAELQLEAADGVNETPFVTVKVTVGDDDAVAVEAFQVSQQCMSMVAEQALEIDATTPGVCRVNDTFTAVQEGKDSKTVDNNFFLTVVPIVQHTSELLIADFPKLNRDHDNRTPSQDELKRQLRKSGTAGWTMMDVLADFSLLLYLAQFLDVSTDFPKICASIVNRDLPLDDGYKLIIAGIAGMDGSY